MKKTYTILASLLVITMITMYFVYPKQASAALEFSYLGETPDPANLTTYTFSSESLGAADANRYIIVGVVARKGGTTGCSITSVTIGGVSATEILDQANTDSNCDVAGLYIANVPTGTTGDVVVTFGETMVRSAIGLWRAVNIDSPTPTDFSASTASDPTYNIDVSAGGFAVGMCISNSNSSATWSGVTENFDGTVESFITYTGGSSSFESEQVDTTLTCDFASSGSTPVGVFASWAEAASVVSPTISTNAATSVTYNSATLNGNITSNGGDSITQHGFAWGTNSNLTGGDTATSTLGAGSEGAYSEAKSSLLPSTTYYFRAYATNSSGTGYGSIANFTTEEEPGETRTIQINNGTIKINNGKLIIQ